MDISNKIRSLRINKQFSQDYMASQLGISQRSYSKIENEEVKLDVFKLQKIAEILEVELSELINSETNQFNNFNNNKSITNAVVNNYSKSQTDLQNDIISILKEEISSLKDQIVQKDSLINNLLNKI